MLTMLPPSGPKCLAASREARIRARTLRSNCLWKLPSVIPSRGENSEIPALLTRFAEGLFRFGKKALDIGLLGDIGLHGDGFAALCGYVRNHAVGALFARGVVDHDRRAFGRQMAGDGSANSRRCAGGERHFSLELFRHDLPPCGFASLFFVFYPKDARAEG